MNRPKHQSHLSRRAFLGSVVFGLLVSTVFARSASLRGQVSDQNGAIVVGAKVTVRGSGALAKTTTTDSGGSYSFSGLPPGDYTIDASAPSFILQEPVKI